MINLSKIELYKDTFFKIDKNILFKTKYPINDIEKNYPLGSKILKISEFHARINQIMKTKNVHVN